MTDVPESWINLAASLPWPLPEPRTITDAEVTFDDLCRLYSDECARIELLDGAYRVQPRIEIPAEVLNVYRQYRPTPVHRARAFEELLGFGGRIYCKREDLNPSGSHKPNTAIPQAWYGHAAGLRELVTDTGAGQWGAALAWACQHFGLACTVFMTRSSYDTKPYRPKLMELAGARVVPSPSDETKHGRAELATDPRHRGSLGIGMGEAVEYMQARDDARLALGCMSYYAAMHQTIIGLELEEQLAELGETPELLVGCVGGGTNFTGFISPYVERALQDRTAPVPRCIAVESANVPVLTQGAYSYEHADAFGLTPRVKMYNLGRQFLPPAIHSGGLRYHGKSPILSLLYSKSMLEAVAVGQTEAFASARRFFEAEGIVPAPETAHAIAHVETLARRFAEQGETPTIVMCLSGTGYMDLSAYE